ncbi:hypothetical protein AVEN_224501-1 [Araneus ventricosus]|uniref:Uncharacterized protein n=1 Tax=Araneus ventricosus TaxID=182803 RepID=A0A4Y2L6K2_ARAVE|nr:hypothetical protein AVEN_224501-1 [Araneus ventricosus]
MNECFARCIDFFDGSPGKVFHKLWSPTGGILSVNVFNISSDCLASGTGSNVVFWKDKDVFDGPAFQRENIVQEVNSSKWRQIKKRESSQAAIMDKCKRNCCWRKVRKIHRTIELFKKQSATVNLSLNADTVEVDYEKEIPAVTSH